MIQTLGIEEIKVPEMCVQLYKDYGTTMAGLRVCNLFLQFCSLIICMVRIIYLRILIIDVAFTYFQAIGYDFDYDDYHRYPFPSLFKHMLDAVILS